MIIYHVYMDGGDCSDTYFHSEYGYFTSLEKAKGTEIWKKFSNRYNKIVKNGETREVFNNGVETNFHSALFIKSTVKVNGEELEYLSSVLYIEEIIVQ